jgi:hypothetical protein
MADTSTVVHIGENSPEEVALKLFHEIVSVEARTLGANLNRKWILDTYSECLMAVRSPASRQK